MDRTLAVCYLGGFLQGVLFLYLGPHIAIRNKCTYKGIV